MPKTLPAAPFEGANENLSATTAPQDVSREDAATFDDGSVSLLLSGSP